MMKKARLVLFALIALLLGMACGKALRPGPSLTYVIESHNWNTATVTFFCGGQVLKREHNIDTGERRIGRLAAVHCQAPEAVTTFIGSTEVVRTGAILGWTPNTTLIMVIENAVGLSTHRLALK